MMALFEFHTIFYVPMPCYVFIDLSLDISNSLPIFEVVPYSTWMNYLWHHFHDCIRFKFKEPRNKPTDDDDDN